MSMYWKLGPQTIERYDFRTRSWQPDGHLNTRRWQFACVILDKKLYVCGGRDGLKTSVEFLYIMMNIYFLFNYYFID
jgi:hypothetical protein